MFANKRGSYISMERSFRREGISVMILLAVLAGMQRCGGIGVTLFLRRRHYKQRILYMSSEPS